MEKAEELFLGLGGEKLITEECPADILSDKKALTAFRKTVKDGVYRELARRGLIDGEQLNRLLGQSERERCQF